MSSVVLIGYNVDMFFVTPNIYVFDLDLYRLIPYRSAVQARVVVPRVNLERFGRRVFFMGRIFTLEVAFTIHRA